MTTKAQSVAVRFLPSLTDVAFILPLVFQFNQMGGAASLLADGDTGWHLRTGEWILAAGRVPRQDMFSFTRPGEPWYAWEWLWDVSFGFLNSHFGLQAVVAASMLLLCCISALLYRQILRKCPNPLLAIALTGLADTGMSIHWLARPHLFTFLFAVLFFSILDRAYTDATPDATRRMLWLLPALTVLWTNLHGGFVAGLIMIGCFGLGSLMELLLAPQASSNTAPLMRAKAFLSCGVLCGLATLVNPYFVSLHEHIFKYLTDPYLYEHITEFMAFNFGHPASTYIEVLMMLGGAAACWNLYHRRFQYFVLLAVWLHLGLHYRRNIPMFSVICAPVAAEAVWAAVRKLQSAEAPEWFHSAVRRFQETAIEVSAIDRLPRLHVFSAAAIALVTALLYAPQAPKSFQAAQNPKEFPVEAASFALHNGYDRIFTTDVWGGYLIYRLYPKAKVYIDGRSDFYGTPFELKYLDVVGAKYDWEQNLATYDAETVLVPADYALATALKENPRWRVVYDDKVAIIFRPASIPRTQQVSSCPNRDSGETCGQPAADALLPGAQPTFGIERPKTNFVAEIGPPRLPLLNRP